MRAVVHNCPWKFWPICKPGLAPGLGIAVVVQAYDER